MPPIDEPTSGMEGPEGPQGPQGPPGPSATLPIWWVSRVSALALLGATTGSQNGATGVQFVVGSLAPLTCSGVRFYGMAGKTYKVSLWDVATATRLTFKTLLVATSGIATITFDAAVALTAGKRYAVSAYDTAGNQYVFSAVASADPGKNLSPYLTYLGGSSPSWWGAADAMPAAITTTEIYIVEPVIATV